MALKLETILFYLILIFFLNCSVTQIIVVRNIPPAGESLYWDEVAELLAGVNLSENNRFKEIQNYPKYKSYQKKIEKYWKVEEKNYLSKVHPWREKNISPSENENTILYPLSGADFINLYNFNPNAHRYIMIGLQNPGHISDPLKLKKEEFTSVLPNLESLVYELSYMNYYTSKRLERDSKNIHISGVLPIIMIFMKRLGFTIVDCKQVSLDENGQVLDKETQNFNREENIPGIKISFYRAGDDVLRDLYFFKIFLNKNSATNLTPEGKYFLQEPRFNLILKSAEYILHTNEYEEFIKAILEKTDRVIEDESGIPLRLFDPSRWEVKVFGKYIGRIPLKKTPSVPYQKDLAKLFEEQKPSVLPFNFGYGVLRGKSKSNLIFLKRKLIRD